MATAAAPPSIVATLATGVAKEDLRLFLFSLANFNPNPPSVYLLCDDEILDSVVECKYPGKLFCQAGLNGYTGLTRKEMEATPGKKFSSLWFDFMAEKLTLLDWVFRTGPTAPKEGVLFCDSDICFFGPLPNIPAGACLGLSQHHIRPADEAKYGMYNGGFLFIRDPELVDVWRRACSGARFYEQSALEDVAVAVATKSAAEFYTFPRTQNYGWWRLWQGAVSPVELQREWTMNRNKCAGASGILVAGEPLGSVHTHFGELRDAATFEFNRWLFFWLQKLSVHPPAARLMREISRIHPIFAAACKR